MAKKEHHQDPEYDSDDMSAGARLMRYNVSDDPRPDRSILEQGDTIQPRRTASAPQVRYTPSQANLVQAARRTSARPAGDVVDDEFVTAKGSLNSDRFPEDDTIFRRKPSELRGDLLYDLAGRHSHLDILSKIAMFHPQAEFGSRDLTWRLANALKSRARKQGVRRQAVKQALDDTRRRNGIAFVPGHYEVDKTAESIHEIDDEADRILRGNVDDIRGEALFKLAGRYTHDQIIAAVKSHHPDTKLTNITVTERLSEAISTKAKHENRPYAVVKTELNTIRDSHNVPYARQAGRHTNARLYPESDKTEMSGVVVPVVFDSDEEEDLIHSSI